jgi:hypothetical protein
MEALKGIEPQDEKQRVARIIAVMFTICAALHIFNAPVRFDWISVALLIFAFTPWLGYFIKKVGKDGIEPIDPSPQSVYLEEVVSVADAMGEGKNNPSFTKFKRQSKTVLNTLYFYQKKEYGLDSSKRWVYVIPFHDQRHARFQEGILELHDLGLVSFDVVTKMYGLTNEGIKYVRDHSSEIENHPDKYTF